MQMPMPRKRGMFGVGGLPNPFNPNPEKIEMGSPILGKPPEEMEQPKQGGVNWIGVLADALAGAAGREGPYLASIREQKLAQQKAQEAQAERQARFEDAVRLKQWERQNPNPYRFEDNAGNVWQIGTTGQPERIFTDMAPKQYFQDGQLVTVSNPYAGAAPSYNPNDWSDPVDQFPGGASSNAGGGFRR